MYNKEQLEAMKVDELRKLSKELGLTIGTKEKRFTKATLIKNIISEYEKNKSDEEEEWDVSTDTKTCTEEEKYEPEESERIKFAETLEQIETKYLRRKQQKIYDNKLSVGCIVVFIHYVEAKATGEIYKKLRTAKVVAINRKSERVKIQTLLGTEMELSFEDLIYIRENRENSTYPLDIKMYLKKQRTEKGKEVINEKFEGASTN